MAAIGAICSCASENRSVMNIIKNIQQFTCGRKLACAIARETINFLFWPNGRVMKRELLSRLKFLFVHWDAEIGEQVHVVW